MFYSGMTLLVYPFVPIEFVLTTWLLVVFRPPPDWLKGGARTKSCRREAKTGRGLRSPIPCTEPTLGMRIDTHARTAMNFVPWG